MNLTRFSPRLSTRFHRIGALALLFTVAACDSDGDGDVDEADLLVGGWGLSGVTDMGGTRDRLADFDATFSSFSATFESGNTVRVVLERTNPTVEDPNIDITAVYELDQTLKRLTLTVGAAAVPFTYEFENDDTLKLTTGAALMNAVFGTSLEGESTITLQRAD